MEERNEGANENPEDPAIYQSIGLMVDVYENLQKPTEDKFQGSQNVSNAPEKRNPCRTVAVGLGLLTLLLLAGITGLGIHNFLEKTDWGVERGLLLEGNANLNSRNYDLTQRISQSEKEVAQLQERLDGRKCCPQNWRELGNHCYYVSTSIKTWEESKKDCEKQYAHLVTITSEEEQKFISGLRVRAWIGLDKQEDGVNWKWVDGSPVTTTYWGPGQPNNYREAEDCVVIDGGDFLWHDYPCGVFLRWICKMEI